MHYICQNICGVCFYQPNLTQNLILTCVSNLTESMFTYVRVISTDIKLQSNILQPPMNIYYNESQQVYAGIKLLKYNIFF